MSLTTPTTVLHRPSFGGASPECQAFADGAFTGPEPPRQRFAHDEDAGRARVIVAFVEIPALDDIDADRLE